LLKVVKEIDNRILFAIHKDPELCVRTTKKMMVVEERIEKINGGLT